jgi:hypothetical protein
MVVIFEKTTATVSLTVQRRNDPGGHGALLRQKTCAAAAAAAAARSPDRVVCLCLSKPRCLSERSKRNARVLYHSISPSKERANKGQEEPPPSVTVGGAAAKPPRCQPPFPRLRPLGLPAAAASAGGGGASVAACIFRQLPPPPGQGPARREGVLPREARGGVSFKGAAAATAVVLVPAR